MTTKTSWLADALKDQMNRRHFLKSAAGIPVLAIGCSHLSEASSKRGAPRPPTRRVRPGDPAWPSAANWDGLNREVGGRLIKVQSPVAACRDAPNSAACGEFFTKL